MFERLRYFFQRVLSNMRQTPVLTAATTLTVAVALTLVAVFAILAINVQRLGELWGGEVQVVAYLESSPATELLKQWQSEIQALPEVEGVQFISQQTAFERFEDSLGRDKDLLRGVTPEVLPASLEISLASKARNTKGAEAVARFLEGKLGLKDLHYGQAWLEKFESFMVLLRLSGLVLGGILLGATLFIVFNTISLTLYARRDELEIMSLVGGTHFFIKMPFILEGVIQGAIGGGLALVVVYGLFYLFLQDGLQALFLSPGHFNIIFLPALYQGLLVVGGIGLGLLGSLGSLRKFVRI